jgi:hypothetical protein
MSAQLHPSFLRATASVLASMVAVAAAGYFWEGYHNHHWWSRDYLLSLLIPFAIMPAVVCVVWVPWRLEFSPTELTIQFLFRPLHTIEWDDLHYYGWFRGVYGLQFRTSGTLTFYPQALPRREWRAFKTFLRTTFPERKASGSIGGRLFQWPWKKKET